MTKTMILSIITKLSTAYKALFATKTELNDQVTTLQSQISSVGSTASNTASELTNLKNSLANLGTFVGAADTYAELPTTDQLGKAITAGDLAYLNVQDGDHKVGLYKYDGTNYVWIAGSADVTDIFGSLKATTLDDTVDNKFVTPKWVKDYNDSQEPSQTEVDNAVNS